MNRISLFATSIILSVSSAASASESAIQMPNADAPNAVKSNMVLNSVAYLTELQKSQPEIAAVLAGIMREHISSCGTPLTVDQLRYIAETDMFVSETLRISSVEPGYLTSADYHQALQERCSSCS